MPRWVLTRADVCGFVAIMWPAPVHPSLSPRSRVASVNLGAVQAQARGVSQGAWNVSWPLTCRCSWLGEPCTHFALSLPARPLSTAITC